LLNYDFIQVQAPAMLLPTPEQFFNKHGQDRSKPDIAFLKNHFYREGRVNEDQALWILEKATDILRKEANVLEVDAPITGARLSYPSGISKVDHFLSDEQFAEISMGNMYVSSSFIHLDILPTILPV
jgi:hypothetical protein